MVLYDSLLWSSVRWLYNFWQQQQQRVRRHIAAQSAQINFLFTNEIGDNILRPRRGGDLWQVWRYSYASVLKTGGRGLFIMVMLTGWMTNYQ